MTDVTAGIGLAQMKRYRGLLARRKEIIEYDAAFKPLGIEVLKSLYRRASVLWTSLYYENSGNYLGTET